MLPKLTGGLRVRYRTLQLPGANPLKDARAVLAACRFSAKKDGLARLLALNQRVATRIEKGKPVTTPEAQKLVTGNYIWPAQV